MQSPARTRCRVLITAAALVAAMAIPPLAGVAAATPVRPAGAAEAALAAARAAAASAVPHYQHIAVILFTDHGYPSILGNSYAPTFNRLAKEYGLASNYYGTSDPDVADMLAVLTGKTYSVNDGIPYWDQQMNVPSLLSQLTAAHLTWKEYAQSMPYAGYLGDCYPLRCLTTDTLYNQVQFNSVPYLASVAGNPVQARNMVPAVQLAADARDGTLPNFSFIDPNECANMHGGPPWCEDSPNFLHQPNDNRLVSAGDSYLKQVTSEIMSGPQWRTGNNAIVVSFTEGTGHGGCCDANPGDGRVFTVVITSHGPRHLVDPTPFNHYSLLSTIQHAFGLGCLNFTCDTAHVAPMAKLFGAQSDAPVRPSPLDPAKVHPAASRPVMAVPRAAASTWHQVATPNPSANNDNDLTAIAGRSPSDIWAVGSLLPRANATIVRTLAIHYNGKTWAAVRTPRNGAQASSFYGVAALPDGTAWAVGIHTRATGHTSQSLAEHWDGHAWTVVPTPNPGSAEDMLYSVTAVSDNDVWAAGTYAGPDNAFHPLLEHWNGTSWSVVPVPGPGTQDGILTSVTSSPGQGVWAAGQLAMSAPDRQVVLHLVGSSWTVVPEPGVRTPGGAMASAYPEGIAVTAAGPWVTGNDRAGDTGFSTLVQAPGAGGRLHELPTPNPTVQDNYLWGIAPVRGGHAWAVGYSLPPATGNAASLIEYGSATGGWKAVPSPDPGAANGNTVLYAVLAFSPKDVWAVGTYDGMGGMQTLALHYTGS
jgi:Phosphoesterase family